MDSTSGVPTSSTTPTPPPPASSSTWAPGARRHRAFHRGRRALCVAGRGGPRPLHRRVRRNLRPQDEPSGEGRELHQLPPRQGALPRFRRPVPARSAESSSAAPRRVSTTRPTAPVCSADRPSSPWPPSCCRANRRAGAVRAGHRRRRDVRRLFREVRVPPRTGARDQRHPAPDGETSRVMGIEEYSRTIMQC